MKAWAGLGYYSRARNLKRCAEHVAGVLGGRFPEHEAGLRALPGVGAYTAAAIAAIAFDRPAAVVDGNVERVVARLYAIATPLPAAKTAIRACGGSDGAGGPARRLRAGHDGPRRHDVHAAAAGLPRSAPSTTTARRSPPATPSTSRSRRRAGNGRCDAAPPSWRCAADGAVLLRKRAANGLLGGMTEVPTSGWTARPDGATAPRAAPFPAAWRRAGSVAHVFTHFSLDLSVFRADRRPGRRSAGRALVGRRRTLGGEALPTVMKKAIEAAKPGATLPRPRGT